MASLACVTPTSGIEGLSLEERGGTEQEQGEGGTALVCIIGPPGSGKSTLGQALSVEFPKEFYSLSIGEEMRKYPGSSAESIIRGALQCARQFGARYAVVDGSFREDGILALRELASTVLILNLEVDLKICKENILVRGARVGEVENIGLDRINQWDKWSRSTLRAAHLLGSKTLYPTMLDWDTWIRTRRSRGVNRGAASTKDISRLGFQDARAVAKKELAQLAMETLSGMIVEARTLSLPLRPQFSSDVLSDLKSLLRVHTPSFSMPVALENADDLAFLEVNDFMVARKADGTRIWLFRREDPEVFMMSRDKVFKKVLLDMPPWTVLDAEMMQSGSFLIFDILALEGLPVWFKNLKSRIAIMGTLAATMTVKQHYPLTEISTLLASRTTFRDYKVDGLVFTPNTSYMFDGSIMLFKAQSPREISFDIDAQAWKKISSGGWIEATDGIKFNIEVQGLTKDLLKNGGVAVCSYLSHWKTYSSGIIHVKLKYQKLRYDKLTGNAPSTIRSQLKLCVFPMDISGLTPRVGGGGKAGIMRSPIHPAKSCSFVDLQALISSSSAFTTNFSTTSSLAVVNCRSREADPSGIARGLVIDSAAGDVVAVSFPRFYHHRLEAACAAATASVHQKWLCGKCNASNATTASSLSSCYKCRSSKPLKRKIISSSALVRASVKLDGSMIVAYLRHGMLCTNTRSRHNSEQASWARQWLLDYAGQLQEGKTYIFEAVFKDNQIVLEYPFDSLFLLAIFDEDAREIVDPAEKETIADALKVPLTPCIYGTVDLLRSPKYLSSKEGWVVEAFNEEGALVREKLISPDWIVKSRALHRFDPITVWRFCGKTMGISSVFGETPLDLDLLASELPRRHRSEWDAMAAQLCSVYDAALLDLRRISSKHPCIVCGCSSEFDHLGDRICFCDPCRKKKMCINDPSMMSMILRAFSMIRPDPSSASQVPGYEAPPFLRNNFAKGWARPDTTESASCPLSTVLGANETQCIIDFLSVADKALFRTASVSADEYARSYYLIDFERAHGQRMEAAAAELEEEREGFARRAYHGGGGYGYGYGGGGYGSN